MVKPHRDGFTTDVIAFTSRHDLPTPGFDIHSCEFGHGIWFSELCQDKKENGASLRPIGED